MSKVVLKPFELVIAQTKWRGIGKDGQLPWPRLPIDMAHFVEKTTNTTFPDNVDPTTNTPQRNAVIMGRKTYFSIPQAVRPLRNRFNIVVSSQPEMFGDENDGVHLAVVKSFEEAHLLASTTANIDKLILIGGVSIFELAVKSMYCHTIHLTEVYKHYPCDVFFPHIDPDQFEMTHCGEMQMDGLQHDVPVQMSTHTRRWSASHSPHKLPEYVGEQGYLDLMRYVLHNGTLCEDRTGVGTKSIFGAHVRYNLRDWSLPLFTTKRTFYKGILYELLWFIRGCTNALELKAKGVGIWDGNSTRAFLDSRGLVNNVEGDLGPVYGFQWRHFGAEYKGFDADYTGAGVDQLKWVIDEINNNPNSRRIIMSAWNPVALDQMALPPCHVLSQFRVVNGELSCLIYQRSADLALGVPFNVASYSLLTFILAHICGLKPGELVHCMADCHLYLNHLEPIQQQLDRVPKKQPTITIKRQYDPTCTDGTKINSVDAFVYDDFVLEGYVPDAAIKMDMAV